MTRTIHQVERYGALVHEHAEMDELRKTECLCLRCKRLLLMQPDKCRIAESLYAICVADNVAMAITRCPQFEERQ